MDYYRPVTAHVPLRPMGSPDGLGAYFETKYTQGISPSPGGVFPVAYKPISRQSTQGLGNGVDSGGANAVAVYHPIVREATQGLGCGCASASGVGDSGFGALPTWLSGTWAKVGLGAAVLGALWLALGRKKHTANARRRRHRRNSKWSGKYKRSLPDSSFLYVERSGKRHFPYKNAAGHIDLPHLRNAIARIPQSNLSALHRHALQQKAQRILAQHGGYRRAAA